MTRRGFLKLLGLAPLVPLAAKLATAAPAPKAIEMANGSKIAVDGLTLEKLQAARSMLDRNDVPTTDRVFRYTEAQYNELFRQMSEIIPEWGLDADEIVREMARASGLPESTIRSNAEVQRFRKRSDAAKRGWDKRREREWFKQCEAILEQETGIACKLARA